MSSSSFLVIFGTIWLLMVGFMTSSVVFSGSPLEILWFLSIFWAIGIILLVIGLRKKIRDRRTNKYGEKVYAKILDVYFSGTTVNSRREFRANFLTYIPSQRRTKIVSEIIGFEPNLYPVNGYVKGKYYKDDINIDKVISIDSVPLNIRESIKNGNMSNGINFEENYGDGYDYEINGPISSSNDSDSNDSGGIQYK